MDRICAIYVLVNTDIREQIFLMLYSVSVVKFKADCKELERDHRMSSS